MTTMLDIIDSTARACDIRVEGDMREIDGKPILLLKPIGKLNDVATFRHNVLVNLEQAGIFTRPTWADALQ